MSHYIDGIVYKGTIEELLLFIYIIVLLFVIPLIPARIDKRKGYSFAVFYVFGLFAFIPALITSLVVRKKECSKCPVEANERETYPISVGKELW